MRGITLLVIFMVILGVIALGIVRSNRREVISRREKKELVRSRLLVHNLAVLAIQQAAVEPFAQVVLDEITKFQRGEIE